MNHAHYTESDYSYLIKKGYTNAEIIKIWNDDKARNAVSVTHVVIPGIVEIMKN
jgi:hypothetical protein